MTLVELNIFYLEHGSEAKALVRMNTPKSEIHKRLIKYKNSKVRIPKKIIRSKDEERLKNFKEYKEIVWQLTESQNLSYIKNIEKRSFKFFHLDHKISIFHGFLSGISPKDIASLKNLRIIPASDNIKKHTKSFIDDENYFLESQLKPNLKRFHY